MVLLNDKTQVIILNFVGKCGIWAVGSYGHYSTTTSGFSTLYTASDFGKNHPFGTILGFFKRKNKTEAVPNTTLD